MKEKYLQAHLQVTVSVTISVLGFFPVFFFSVYVSDCF